ncbi:MAG: YdbH domain-containing protein [Desulfobulbaceae bacterium]|nr:YdbH domain-containing protein [Desulfobulbaceae bacterium]
MYAVRLRKWLPAVCCITAVILLLFSRLPWLTEKFILPQILPAELSAHYHIAVYRLGLHGSILRISTQPGTEPLAIDGNILIHWSLAGLKNRQLDSLVLEGMQVRITGQPPSSPTLSAESSPSANGSGRSFPPLVIENFQVVNSTVILDHQKTAYRIPFSLDAERIAAADYQEEEDVLRYRLHGSLAAQEVTAELKYQHRQQLLSSSARARIDIHALAREIRDLLPPDLEISGMAEISLAAETDFSSFSLRQLQADGGLEDLLVRSKGIFIRSREGNPAAFSLSGMQDEIILDLDGLAIESPLQAAAHVHGSFFPAGDSLRWQGILEVQPAAGQKVAEYILAQAPPVKLRFEGEYHESGLRGSFSSDQVDSGVVPYIVDLDKIRLEADRLDIESEWRYSPQDAKKLNYTLLFTGEDITLTSPEALLELPRLQLKGTGVLDTGGNKEDLAFSAGLDIIDAAVHMEHRQISLSGIHLQSPFSWPPGQEQQDGVLRIENILLRDIKLGSLNTTVVQDGIAAAIQGTLDSGLLPGAGIAFTGALHMPDEMDSLAVLTFAGSSLPLEAARLSPLFPGLASLDGSGLLNVQGRVTVFEHGTTGFIALEMENGILEIPELKTRAEGISLALDFPDLPSLRTSPRQNLSIRKLTNRDLLLADVTSDFRLESPETFFVEKISADWSGGRIFTGSVRLNKESPDFEAALICDRLNLAEILTQLGLARAEGVGDVSGRIPLRYENGNFYVDDGFLFSTPGEKGSLKILESEQLTGDIPQDVPQFSPIYFAGAALKNFQYNWAKLLVSSEDENMQLKLQIDGKPTERLPYRFDPGQNAFVRLAEGQTGGIDQPLNLNVNFNVPLNELLLYYKNIKPFFQNR